MKKFLVFTLVAISMIIVGGCDKDSDVLYIPTSDTDLLPKVDFNVGTNGSLTVQFNNQSSNADRYLWEFGDGTSSDEVSPLHTYVLYGEKTVKLTAYNSYGNKSITKILTLPAPTGKLKLVSTSDNPYQIYIDGTYQLNIEGHGVEMFTLTQGTHTVRVLQISGYLFSPTDETYQIPIEAGMIYTKNFPVIKESEK